MMLQAAETAYQDSSSGVSDVGTENNIILDGKGRNILLMTACRHS
jgi:hypothetical protein